MEAYYLDNSGFALYLEHSLAVFDYYNPTADGNTDKTGGVIGPEDLVEAENVFVFASHVHGDHFNPAIFRLQEHKSGIRYYLDEAIGRNGAARKAQNTAFLRKGNIVKEKDILVQAFGSTDEGISFYAEIEGVRIFHAGDLNDWHWRDSSTPEEAAAAHKAFLMEMADIEANIKDVDIAFFPVDPAIGEGYDEGAIYFIEAVKPKYFIPMHSRGGTGVYETFRQKMEGSGTQILTYRSRGDKIIF